MTTGNELLSVFFCFQSLLARSESLGRIIVPKDLLDYLSGPGLTVTTPDEQNCHI